jgi:hypothetical protein
MPRPGAKTMVFAVPKSIARSLGAESKDVEQHSGCPPRLLVPTIIARAVPNLSGLPKDVKTAQFLADNALEGT